MSKYRIGAILNLLCILVCIESLLRVGYCIFPVILIPLYAVLFFINMSHDKIIIKKWIL